MDDGPHVGASREMLKKKTAVLSTWEHRTHSIL